MLIGLPKEIKNHEYRVGITPSGVKELVSRGHKVLVETNAGKAIGFLDKEYIKAGAKIAGDIREVYSKAELIIKVKEPQEVECDMIREGQVLFCFLHLAAEEKLTRSLMETGSIGVAFETITDDEGKLPILAPMSAVAGRVAVQVGAYYLQKNNNGRGVLLGGVAGVLPGKVVILGGGVVGVNSATIALGMQANVTIIEKSEERIRELEILFGNKVKVIPPTAENIDNEVKQADLLIGGVLIPGAAAPNLVSKELVSKMLKGSVIVDVAVDQGGCIETIHATTHENPVYEVDGVWHYGVTNMPAAVARTSTQALENETLPYTIALADKGYKKALMDDPHFLNGLNIYRGALTNRPVADALNIEYTDLHALEMKNTNTI